MERRFDQIIERRKSGSLKWDTAESELPMWVADMDFQTAPAVTAALRNTVQRGVFGYCVVTQEWYQAIIDWWRRRHQFLMQKDWLTFCTGVVPAVTCAVKRMTNVGDNIVVQTPVYDIFFHSIENHGRHVLENRLKYRKGQYSVDFVDLEEKLADPLTTMMILCNPHNPTGTVWTKEELARMGELCGKYHVTVLSDEIHCDLTAPGCVYTPFASVSDICREISITCISATKAFNIAGLQTSAVVLPNERIRSIMVRGMNADEIAEPNSFAVDAAAAAFREGEEWLEELRVYLAENRQFASAFLNLELPRVKPVNSQATYLLWLDCSDIPGDTEQLGLFLRREEGLILSPGIQYRGNGESFLRMNLACPRERLTDGLNRLKKGVERYEKWAVAQC